MMEVTVLPWSGDDVFHQKCYASNNVLLQLGATIGQFVCIQTGCKPYICCLWPRAEIGENCISFMKTVSSVRSDPVAGDDGVKLIQVLSPTKAISVTVTVILKNIEVVVSAKNTQSTLDNLHSQSFNILQWFCVCSGSTVDCSNSKFSSLVGISYIVITDVECDSENDNYAVIGANTTVILSQVHSKEWHKQVTTQTKISKPGGLDTVINMLTDFIKLPSTRQEDFVKLGVKPPRGILLRGPPGCGKTSLVRYLAHSVKSFLIPVNGPEIFGPLPGETEGNVRNIFHKAKLMCSEGLCILFIDEIDSICPKPGKSAGMHEARATAQLVATMDKMSGDNFLVIAATNRPGALDPALRRPGRLDRELLISPPDAPQRLDILQSYTQTMPISTDLDLASIATVTNGYVGADLVALCREASYVAIAEQEKLVTQRHFTMAVKKVRPSLQKGAEGVVDLTPVHWHDIGGLEDVKHQIQQAVEWPIKHPGAFELMGLPPPRGVLLYGPPGCCKTTLVRAAATACHSTFLSVSGAQLYSPYVGDSERLIAEVFQKARACAPSILFLDEIDSIIGKRSESGNHGIQGRILSMLLNEMDGIGVRLDDGGGERQTRELTEGSIRPDDPDTATTLPQDKTTTSSENNKAVLVVAATNRPDLLDEALMRPGRMDKIIYVQHPDQQARLAILKVYTKKMCVHEDCDLVQLSSLTDMYTGADLESLCREAALCALTEDLSCRTVTIQHFRQALQAVKPSLTQHIIQQYSNINVRKLR